MMVCGRKSVLVSLNLKDELLLETKKTLFEKFVQYYRANPDVNVVIFGVGDLGMFMKKILSENNICIQAFCDNDPLKQGMIIKGLKVISPQELKQFGENVIVIINDSYHKEKRTQLEVLGIRSSAIWRFDAFNFLYKNFTREYILGNFSAFEKSYSLLADDQSRSVFAAVLNGVLTGDLFFYEQVMTSDEYFPQNIVPKRNDHVFLDVGAYNGNTSQEFIRYFSGNYNKIYAFEPLASSAELVKDLQIEHLEVYTLGVSDKSGTQSYYCNDYGELTMVTTVQGAGAKDRIVRFETDTIDHILQGRKATFIKMDIEGSELAAIHGAKETIIKNKPFLAVCVYHKREDLIEIIQYLKKLVPDYQMYLRHHSNTPSDTVLYCICDNQ